MLKNQFKRFVKATEQQNNRTTEIKVYGDVADCIVFKKPVSKHYMDMCFLRLKNAI
jgi:hypothetical protein